MQESGPRPPSALRTAALLHAARVRVRRTLADGVVRDIAILAVVTRIAVALVAYLGASLLRNDLTGSRDTLESLALGVWTHWDGAIYLDIANRGYAAARVSFFPLYPGLIHLLTGVLGNGTVAALAIANGAFFVGLLYLYRLVAADFDGPTARRAVTYIAIFPTAIFFSATYTESLFFCLSVAAIYNVRRDRPLLAGVLGLLAALTRNQGLLLVVPFIVQGIVAPPPGRGLARYAKAIAGAALVPLGLLLYMAYLHGKTGDALAFIHAQGAWHRHLSPPSEAVGAAFQVLQHSHGRSYTIQLVELAFTTLGVAALVLGIRRLPAAYTAYAAVSLLLPMSTGALLSMPRFMLVIFPFFALFALWGKNALWNNVYVGTALPLLGLFTALFAGWYWVG